MNITVFTSNQPRHTALIERLAEYADKVYAIQECCTVIPGQVNDFYRKTPVMQDYFSRVLDAERVVFGKPRFSPTNVTQLPIRMGDLNMLDLQSIKPALKSDVYVVFGSSFIKPPLLDPLLTGKAINIHMGVSPYYRGSSTNFWAMYDNHPEYVGSTIHMLTAGLDSGPIIRHALPAAEAADPFTIGMKAVRAAHEATVDLIRTAEWRERATFPQDRTQELRYSRAAEFTDEIAEEYLQRLLSPEEMVAALSSRSLSDYVDPYMF